MSQASRSEEASLPLAQVRQIDAACLSFEKAWKAGQRPRIEDFLSETPEPGRAVLLRELIALDMDYRRRAGETPRAQEYQALFPSLDPAQLNDMPETQAPTLSRPAHQPMEKPAAIPGYDILGELGRGGMGIVYRAWQSGFAR